MLSRGADWCPRGRQHGVADRAGPPCEPRVGREHEISSEVATSARASSARWRSGAAASVRNRSGVGRDFERGLAADRAVSDARQGLAVRTRPHPTAPVRTCPHLPARTPAPARTCRHILQIWTFLEAPLMLHLLFAFVLALGSALPAAAQSTAINGTIEGTVPDDAGRRAAWRHRHRRQHRHRRSARRSSPTTAVSSARRCSRSVRYRVSAELQGFRKFEQTGVRAVGRHDGGDQHHAHGRRGRRNDHGARRFADRRSGEDRAGPDAHRGGNQDAAADLAQSVQLRAAAARSRRLREQRVRRRPPHRQRRAAPRQLSGGRQQQHAEGSRRPAADADVRGDDPRGQGRHHRLRARVRPDDGSGLQRDHAVGHQPVQGAGQLPLPAEADGGVPVLHAGRTPPIASRRPT